MPRSATTAHPKKTKRPSPKKAKATAPKKPKRPAVNKAKPATPKMVRRAFAKKTRRTPNKAKQTSVAVMQAEISALRTELQEARDQQTATAEVLGVINSSPGDLAPVFDAILKKAMGLCGAAFGLLFTYDGEQINAAALHNIPQGFAEFLRRGPVTPAPHTALASAVREREPTQIPDVLASGPYRESDPFAVAAVETGGVRTVLSVPLVRDDAVLGVIAVFRQEVRAFTYKQIALLQNFAAQAVIAMENARLLGQLRERTDDLTESLEYQTATSDVLKVISHSSFDLQPVLDTLVETATRLCAAEMGFIFRRDGEVYRLVANVGFPPAFEGFMRGIALTPGRESVTGRAAAERQAVQAVDIAADPDYAVPETIELGRARTMVGLSLLRQGEPIGVITLARQRVESFNERQIELVRTFADQAVIAIENARLPRPPERSRAPSMRALAIWHAISPKPRRTEPRAVSAKGGDAVRPPQTHPEARSAAITRAERRPR